MNVIEDAPNDFAELAAGVDDPPDELARRDFLRVMGAALAMTGLAGCTRAPDEAIVPYVSQPPEARPGVPSFYATAMVTAGVAIGLLVESHEGRPTKVEGNPEHPASLGATGAMEQASVLDLYDPNRASAIRRHGAPETWSAFARAFARPEGDRGRGLHVLLEATGSPLVADQLARLRARFPECAVHLHGDASRPAAWEGARLAFGKVLDAHLDLSGADVIVALDADFLTTRGDSLRLARQFADRRRVHGPADTMSRLYVAEAALSVTGAAADHRLAMKCGKVLALGAALLAAVAGEAKGLPAAAARVAAWSDHRGANARWIDAVASDLGAHRGRCVVIAGDGQPAAVHAIAHALNALLGNFGRTVSLTPSPIVDAGGPGHDLRGLARALAAGAVDTLLVLGANPVYTAPRDLDLAARIRDARESAFLGAYENETARVCDWFVPQAHYLESWGDARAFDGTISIVQPLIAPLHGGRTVSEVLAVLLGDGTRTPYDLVRDAWRRGGGSNAAWVAALARGVVRGSALPAIDAPDLAWSDIAGLPIQSAPGGLEVSVRLDARVRDGAHANNAWLQELPDPITKLTWGNAIGIAALTASRLAVTTGSVVDVTLGGRTVRGPVLVVPGHADDALSLTLGYGREGAEALARGLGFDAGALRTVDAPWFAAGAALAPTGGREDLAIAQQHGSLEGRDEAILRHRTLAEHRSDPRPDPRSSGPPRSLYLLAPSAPRQWGMIVDLSACTGCSACVVACQSENNVPVVGKTGVLKHREMHWLRIDRYFGGDPREPQVLVEPMLCQHCEKAPCEYVCPVNATTHSAEGLNQMVYNRCVGTRFCSNNCPYKVRRFNWFNYNAEKSDTERLAMNPDVTVRARGVMEKCTYCVQRIREAEIREEVSERPLVDGDVRTACQQACPAGAIVFGDIADKGSRVAKLREDDRAFAVLDELGTIPRTRYLARLRNPNPELA
jgi:Fe-S-cluster-containing dehydrogenase component